MYYYPQGSPLRVDISDQISWHRELCWLSIALLSPLNSPYTHTPTRPSKQLSTAAGKLKIDLNLFVNERQPLFVL
jgi:hypothetical protein